MRRRTSALIAVVLFATLGIPGFLVHRYVSEDVPLPFVRPLDVVELVTDTRPVSIRTTVAWTKVPEVVTIHRLLTDKPLWRRMHFDDWDTVPRDLRERALTAMVRDYERVLKGPSVWREMTAADWDGVPQPIRAMSYLRMIWYWARHEKIGVEFGFTPTQLAPTVAGIVMAESWFEHRAFNENPFGNRDLGLAQCSDYCRNTLAEMAAAGSIDFAPSEADYFNPWVATRVATVWFERELHNAVGDVDLAIRAYHRGIDNALDEKGDTYLTAVHRRRDRYILNRGASESWRFLARTVAPV